jgi:hypothetical protein
MSFELCLEAENMNITDINLESRALCDADTTSYPAATLLRRVNQAYEEIVGKIIGLDGTWQFDDSNFSDLPIGVTTLVNSQNDYSFDSSMLEIERVEVKDKDGLWHLLSPVDKSQINEAMEEFYKTDGIPSCYDKQGASLFLYPAPDNGVSVTLASGLRVYFQRTASVFTSAEVTTGTKSPGFASPYHMLICYKSAIPYCMSYKKDRVALYEKKVIDLEKEMFKFYSRRERDVKTVIRPSGIAFR